MDRPERKIIRLNGYDYSRNGVYFVTICTKDRMCIFWENNGVYRPVTDDIAESDNDPTASVGTANGRPPCSDKIHLSEYVRARLDEIHFHYPMVCVDKYVIMPNHIHVILRIAASFVPEAGGRPMAVSTISRIINQFKGAVSKKSRFPCLARPFPRPHIAQSTRIHRRLPLHRPQSR